MLNRPRQLDFFLGAVTKTNGTVLANGVVVAYTADARESAGRRIFQRAVVYQDPTSLAKFPVGKIYLDANGRPETSQGSGINTSVYGEGAYLLYFYANPANAPTGAELDDADIYANPLDPNYPSTPDRIEIFHASHEVVNAKHFGAMGDANAAVPESGADDTAALQAAIDYCLGIDGVSRPRTLHIPAGTYRITAPLKIMTPGVAGAVPTNLYPTSLHIHGDKELPEGVHPDTIIYMEHLDLPAIMIQAGHGVIIRNIGIYGVNRFDFDYNEVLLKNTMTTGIDYETAYGALLNDGFYYHNWSFSDTVGHSIVGRCRDTSQSPNAAIVIDPFCDGSGTGNNPIVPAGNQYPGYQAYYNLTANGAYSFSSAVLIDGCSIGRFAVGVMISPTGKAANAENIVIRHTRIEICRVGVAIGQNQTRGLNIENCDGYLLHTFVDNRTYGAGIEGAPPNIRGLSLAQLKYIFMLDMGASAASFDQIYAESLLSLGFIGPSANYDQHNVAFNGCDFNFAASHPMTDLHLYGHAGVQFNSCLFTVSGATVPSLAGNDAPPAGSVARPPLRFANFAPIVFENCRLNSGRIEPPPRFPPGAVLDLTTDQDWFNSAPPWGFQEPALVSYRGVGYLDGYKRWTPDDDTTGLSPTSYDPRSARVTFLRQDYPHLEGTVVERLTGSPSAFTLPGLLRQYLPPGATVGPKGAAAGSTIHLRKVSGVMNRIILPVDGSGFTRFYLIPPDTLFFTGLPGQIMLGDVVYIPSKDDLGNIWPIYLQAKATAGNPGNPVLKNQLVPSQPEGSFPVKAPIGSVGAIKTVAGSVRNYIFHAPRSLVDAIQGASGVVDLDPNFFMLRYLTGSTGCIQRFGRYHPATLGTWMAPTNQVTITFPDTSFPFRTVWKRGDRITTDTLSGGQPIIPPGTYVTNYLTAPDRLVLSKQLTVSGTNVRLFDADVLRVAMTGE